MWTVESRARYNRDHLRYPSDLTDEEWGLIAPLIPQAKARFSLIREPVGDEENAGCCQQRIDDDRQSVVPAIAALVGEQP
ncbi:MAG: transposase, partial [Stellaceae bacterium]